MQGISFNSPRYLISLEAYSTIVKVTHTLILQDLQEITITMQNVVQINNAFYALLI